MKFVILIIALNIIKAFHDKHLMRGGFDKKDRRAWHILYWFHYVVMSFGFLFIIYHPNWLDVILGLIAASTARIVFFNTILNKLRGLDVLYVGSEGIDRYARGREEYYYFSALVLFLASSIWLSI